jgi:hypothetical protein
LTLFRFIECLFDHCRKTHYDIIHSIWALPKVTHCLLGFNFLYNDQILYANTCIGIYQARDDSTSQLAIESFRSTIPMYAESSSLMCSSDWWWRGWSTIELLFNPS